MSERTLYLYDAKNEKWSSETPTRSGAILTVSLQSFNNSGRGCAHGINAHLLNQENIGKKFKLSILDPIEIGEVYLLGIVTRGENKCIPEFIYKKMKEEKFFFREGGFVQEFFVFKQNKEYIVVNSDFCDVIPLF